MSVVRASKLVSEIYGTEMTSLSLMHSELKMTCTLSFDRLAAVSIEVYLQLCLSDFFFGELLYSEPYFVNPSFRDLPELGDIVSH